MATLDDLIEDFDRLLADLPKIVLEQTEVAALDALALVDQRITSNGTDQNGSPFPDYTDAYKKRKQKKGRYRGHVDFMDTGQMLNSTTTGFENIAATEKAVSGNNATVAFDGRDQLTRDKIAGNNVKRPGFLLPSKAEVERVSEIAQANMEDRISEYFSDAA